MREIFRAALLLRVVAALFFYFALPEGFFAPDEETYRTRGQAIAASWSSETGYAPFLPDGPVGYYYIVAAFYFLSGSSSLVPKLLNCVVGALSVLLVHDLALRLSGSEASALRAARYAAWFPSLVLWSTLNIRDAWIVFLILLIAREAAVLQAEFRLATLLLLAGSMLALIQFRAYILLPVAAPVVLSFFVQRSRNLGRNLLIGSIAAVALIYADQAAGSNRKLRVIDLEQIQVQRNFNTADATSRFEQADISTPQKALFFLPKGLAYFLLAPFPWMLGSVRQLLAVPETIFFYWLLPHIFSGISHLLRHHMRQALMAILITAALTFGYALGEGNAGTAYRHRAQILNFFLIFAAVGIESRRVTMPRRAV